MTDERTKEALRYLGYGRKQADSLVAEKIGQAFRELERTADRRFVSREFDLSLTGDGEVWIGGMHIRSRSPLGAGVDRLLRRQSLTDMADAVVTQACAAAMLEAYLDEEQERIAGRLAGEGRYLRPRFSPGYGDFSIRHQGQILAMLEAPKRIGLSMTDSCMLTPVKSVTAVAGISRHREPCHRRGCEACEKRDCIYRRNEG